VLNQEREDGMYGLISVFGFEGANGFGFPEQLSGMKIKGVCKPDRK